jgi:hypothetical protein
VRRTLAAQLTEENVEAVAALDLHSQYDEDIAERDRRQRRILAWQQGSQLAGFMSQQKSHLTRRELDTGYCGIMRSCLKANFRFNRRDPDGISNPPAPDAARRAYKLRRVRPRARILLGVLFKATSNLDGT